MRADDERQLAGGELRQRVGAPLRRRGSRQQRDAHDLAGHQRLQRREVLLGEDLGRRHEDGLHVVLDRAQDRVQRDDGLARADLPHQQPLHRARPARSRVEHGDRRALVAGQLERQQLVAPAPVSAGGAVEHRRAARLAPLRAPAQQRRAGRAAARRTPAGGGRPRGRRRARRRARRARSGQPPALRTRAGSGSTASWAARQVRAHEREDLRRGQALRRRVVRDLAAAPPVLSAVGAWPVDAETRCAAELAVQHEPRARRVLAREPRLVEERRLHHRRSRRRPAPRRAASCRAGAPAGWRSSGPRRRPSHPRRASASRPCAPRGGRAAGARAGRRPSRGRARSPRRRPSPA